MLKRSIELIPSLSVLALAILAIFNVGYFSKIGIHFLGVVDLSNIVYSFGLVFGALGLFSAVIGFDWLDGVRRNEIDYVKLYGWLFGLRILGLTILLTAFLGLAGYLSGFFGSDFYLAAATGLMFLIQFLTGIVRQNAYGKANFGGDYGLGILMFILSIFFVGRGVASSQVSFQDTYTVTTKDAVLKRAHLVRSSSMGFIIAIDGVIRFIPSGELKEIRADGPLGR